MNCLKTLAVLALLTSLLKAQIAIKVETLHTMAGPSIRDAVVVITGGKIAALGPAASVTIPESHQVLTAKVATPGLIDAHSVVGLAGWLNQDQDQDQLDRNDPIQAELRAVDAYNPEDPLVAWVRSFGVTTLHTGHAPGQLVSGQTMIVKTHGRSVAEALVRETAAIAVTLSEEARGGGDDDKKKPGTRGKLVALLRAELIKAREYADKLAANAPGEPTPRNLRLETLGRALRREIPFLVTAHRMQDLQVALEFAKEFNVNLWIDGASEIYRMLDTVKGSGHAVLLHAPMMRATGDRENASFETAQKLRGAGIPFALQSGYESYVPKTRVVLLEAAVTTAFGQSESDALASITREAARILGVADRLGTLEIGKDGDLALYDGPPLETTSHCVATIIEGKIVFQGKR